MLNPSSSVAKLFDAPVRLGRVVWVGSRPARREPMLVLDCAVFEAGRGVSGDRYSRLDGGRQVTLIEAESLAAMASYLAIDIPPEAARRNVVTQGINLLSLKERRFRIGAAVLETSGECHPCSRMEEIFGVGGYNAMRGRGGITASVVVGGVVLLGDTIQRLELTAGPVGPL